LNKNARKKVLILGSSGWVAHYVIFELISHDFEITGISNKNNPHYNITNLNIAIENTEYLKKVKEVECDYIINMLHAKDFERSYDIHCQLVQFCKESKKHYTYMSSSNAMDGDVTRAHFENEKAKGGSLYGKYKAQCEHYLYENMPNALIVRFPATHGHAPNRIARTEEFLLALQNDKEFFCYTGLYQGRPFVGHLAKMICKAIVESESGVFHMSTTDFSDQLTFLRNLAEAFGYKQDCVRVDKEIKWNMTLIPQKIFEKYGDEFKFSEKDTIEALASCKKLKTYHR